ncbi:hypothetical protein BD779DRAFT_1610786 [Infundibulicybe gibba]|nr:hypothetical protein BD779DRAFT_1610786 [Infundibulicybe gibba]
MVEPFSRSIRGKSKTGARMASTPAATTGTDEKANKSATMLPSTAAAMSATSSEAGCTNTSATDVAGGVGMQASTSKAKKVMQWFRTKNKGRESIGLGGDYEEVALADEKERDGPRTPTQTKFNRRVENASDTSNVGVSPVHVFVTTPSTPVPQPPPPVSISASAPLHPQRTPSTTTVDSTFTPSLVTRFRNSITVGGSISGGSGSRGSKSAKTGGEALRIHHGAVDQTTVTTGSPPDVMKHVREVLEGMGIEVQVESEYKYRCVRGKKRKGVMSNGVGVGVIGNVGVNGANGSGVAAVAMMGTAASNGVDKRGLPVPSQSSFSSTGGMLRGLLMRRQSSQVSSTGLASTSQPSLPYEEDSAIATEPSGQDSVYGDPAQDAGDEVRFSVELTRMSGLTGTYSLDIRRLKGNLRSYKFLYDTLRE